MLIVLNVLLVYALPVLGQSSLAKVEKLVFLIVALSTLIVLLVLLMVNALLVWIQKTPAQTEKLVFLFVVLSTLIALLVLMINAMPVLV